MMLKILKTFYMIVLIQYYGVSPDVAREHAERLKAYGRTE